MATKTSITCFYLSFSKEEQIFRWCNYLNVFVVNAAGFALTFLNIFQCQPFAATFEYPLPETASCSDILTLYLSSAPVNIITDLALLFLPMPILTSMRLPKKQKIILVITFSFGIFVAAVDVIRIAALSQASFSRARTVESGNKNSRVVQEQEYSWYAAQSFMWCAVEVNVGIICGCVPSLKPLFARFLPKFIKSTSDPVSQREKSGSAYASGSVDNDRPKGSPPQGNEITNPAAFKTPTNVERDPGDGEMGFLDFLHDAEGEAPVSRSTTIATSTSRPPTGRRGSLNFLDFYNVNKPKNMLKTTNRESFVPIALVTILFFLWGFAYGLLDILNAQFKVVVNMNTGQSDGLHAAYYAGYFAGPLTLGHFIFKKYGFRATMMTGLVIYAIGTLVFWPSAVLTSYPAFVVSNFIVGFGLSCLEVSSNSFIALCGPMEYAEVRLNFSQGFQAIGSVVSPLLAKKVLFRSVLDTSSLINVQWTYLGIALFDVLLALVFYYLPIPEASDEDFDELADRHRSANTARVGGMPVIWVTLALAVFCQFCYVGGQESVGVNVVTLSNAVYVKSSGLTGFDYETIGHSVFAIGRFAFAFLNYLLKPRWILLGLYLGLIITSALTMRLTGQACAAMIQLAYLFESGAFSIIYAICLRGMGAYTKLAAALVTAAISGGAVFPVIQSAVTNGHSIQYSWCVVVAVSVFGTIFPVYLNVFPQARRQVDPVHEARNSRRQKRKATLRNMSDGSDSSSRQNIFGLAGIVARVKKRSSDIPTVEHHENKGQVGSHMSSGIDFITQPEQINPSDQRPQGNGMLDTDVHGGQKHELALWPD
ncbi:MAG: hypothetical protein Q9160_004435 [Pyrenula sp. 1 TL-2023]